MDWIGDFRSVDDPIHVENAVFTRLTKIGTRPAGAFRIGANGKGLAVKFATLVTKPPITAADFSVI